ncbi:unnamed protein product [Discula destructiva]
MSVSALASAASISRMFRNPRAYPSLPKEYNWPTQKGLYSPPGGQGNTKTGRIFPLQDHRPHGYVFCHRGLYDRALRIVDNSNAAVDHGLNEGFFLHEIDAFFKTRMRDGFVAHDQTANRVTSKKGSWALYNVEEILGSHLVARGVDLELETPDFESAYLETPEQVPDLEGTIWREIVSKKGLTIQFDLRDGDLATGISWYAFHLSKNALFPAIQNQPWRQHRPQPGQKGFLARRLLHSTMLKGYNLEFDSFDHLVAATRDISVKAYGPQRAFDLEQLHLLPPLVMVFYSHPVLRLAKKAYPNVGNLTYRHIYDTFMKQVTSFIEIGKKRYSFILEITHSGLGLLYEFPQTNKGGTGRARNPLTGEYLTDPAVIFDSLVDRAMIDVSLELRKKHPKLLFSSCTRLPDVIIHKANHHRTRSNNNNNNNNTADSEDDKRYKANHKTGELIPWPEGEAGLATRLRAIHGGLYPQSNVVVADDPMAEIAARTWIDQKARLNRSELLRMPYYQWLRTAGQDVFDAVKGLNDLDFRPNKYGEPVDHSTDESSGQRQSVVPADSTEHTRSWLEGLNLTSPGAPGMPELLDEGAAEQRARLGGAGSVEGGQQHKGQQDQSDPRDDTRPTKWANAKFLYNQDGARPPGRGTIDLGHFNAVVYASHADYKQDRNSEAAYAAAEQGEADILRKLISRGADVNALIRGSTFGTALAAACWTGHLDIVQLLLEKGADVDRAGDVLGSRRPIDIACQRGSLGIVQLLLDHGADVNGGTAGDSFGRSPLGVASRSGHVDVVRMLLDRGADVNAPSGSCGTALIDAIAFGHDTVVQLLLSRNADVNLVNDQSQSGHPSALAAACRSGNTSVVRRLLAAGADVRAPIGRVANAEIKHMLERAGATNVGQAQRVGGRDNRNDLPPRGSWDKVLHKTIRPDPRVARYEPVTMRKGWNESLLPSCGCFLCLMDRGLDGSTKHVQDWASGRGGMGTTAKPPAGYHSASYPNSSVLAAGAAQAVASGAVPTPSAYLPTLSHPAGRRT